jgi:hypothetical protein
MRGRKAHEHRVGPAIRRQDRLMLPRVIGGSRRLQADRPITRVAHCAERRPRGEEEPQTKGRPKAAPVVHLGSHLMGSKLPFLAQP